MLMSGIPVRAIENRKSAICHRRIRLSERLAQPTRFIFQESRSARLRHVNLALSRSSYTSIAYHTIHSHDNTRMAPREPNRSRYLSGSRESPREYGAYVFSWRFYRAKQRRALREAKIAAIKRKRARSDIIECRLYLAY